MLRLFLFVNWTTYSDADWVIHLFAIIFYHSRFSVFCKSKYTLINSISRQLYFFYSHKNAENVYINTSKIKLFIFMFYKRVPRKCVANQAWEFVCHNHTVNLLAITGLILLIFCCVARYKENKNLIWIICAIFPLGRKFKVCVKVQRTVTYSYYDYVRKCVVFLVNLTSRQTCAVMV